MAEGPDRLVSSSALTDAQERAYQDELDAYVGLWDTFLLTGYLGVENARLVVVAISDPLATRRIVSRLRLLGLLAE